MDFRTSVCAAVPVMHCILAVKLAFRNRLNGENASLIGDSFAIPWVYNGIGNGCVTGPVD